MRILYTDEIDPKTLPDQDKLYFYNGLDCLICREVFDLLVTELDEETFVTYNFMLALQAPILEMQLRGCLVDAFARSEKIRMLETDLEKLEHILNTYAIALWGDPLNAGSWKQKALFLYDFLGCTPIRKFDHKAGVSRITTDREAIERLDAKYPKIRPITKCLLAIADISKQLGTLRTQIDSDGWFRAAFNIAGTETGRLSSKKNAFGTGCFPPGAEVLTPAGWHPIETIEYEEKVLQCSFDGELSWTHAIPYEEDFDGNLCAVKTEQVAFTATPNHRFLFQQNVKNVGQPYEETAADLFHRKAATRIQTGATISNNRVVLPKLVIALLADGSLDNTSTRRWRIQLKKARKISRFIQLCAEAKIEYTEMAAKPGYRRFGIYAPEHWPIDWGAWVLHLEAFNACELLHECGFWDGIYRNKSLWFLSSRKYRAEWVQTLAHICGGSATITEMKQPKASWSNTLMYKVNVKPRNYAIIENKHKSFIPYKGKVYCLRVPTTFFLVRQHGKIFVSGNSNFQNINERLRSIFTVPEGPLPKRDEYNVPEKWTHFYNNDPNEQSFQEPPRV